MEIQDIRYYPIDYNLAPDNALTRRLNIVAVVASAICIVLCFAVSKDLYVVMGVVAVAIILYGHAKSSSYGELSFSQQGIMLKQKGKPDISFSADSIQTVLMRIYKEKRTPRYDFDYFVDVVDMKISADNQVVERQFELSPNNLDEQILLTEQMVEDLSEALGRSKVSVSKTGGFAPLPNNVADTRYYIWILSGTLLLLLAIWWIGR